MSWGRKLLFAAVVLVPACACVARAALADLKDIRLPPGFHIDIYAQGIENARSMAMSPAGTLYVGSRTAGKVFAVVDNDKDFKADRVYIIADKLRMPNGVAFRDGSLYVAEINRIIRFDRIEGRLATPPDPVVVSGAFPDEQWHGWKFIRFGPDGKLYVPVGAPCNVCESSDERLGTVMRMNADGSGLEVYARGVRNSVGFDWHPRTRELWFTDNGRDMLGDDLPPDELNRASGPDLHFGFPYCHGGDIADPQYGGKRPCADFRAPARKLGPHVAALGMRFYTGEMFPEPYRQQIFIAEHGSWNRRTKTGYRVMLVRLKDNQPVDYEVFADGWNKGQKVFGRPVDVEVAHDGSLLVSDDFAHRVYRISYGGR